VAQSGGASDTKVSAPTAHGPSVVNTTATRDTRTRVQSIENTNDVSHPIPSAKVELPKVNNTLNTTITPPTLSDISYGKNDDPPSDCNMAIMAVKNYFWAVIFNIYEQLCLVNQKYFGLLYDNCSEEVILFIMPIITLFYLMGVLLYCKILVVWFLFSNLSIVWKESMLYTILILCLIIPFMGMIIMGLSLVILIYSVVSVFKVKLNKLTVNPDAKKIDYNMAKMFYDIIFTKKRTISFILTLFVILFVQSTIGTPYAMLVGVVIFLIYKGIFFQIPIFKNTTPLELFKYEPEP
jgi:hypothetical protein